MIKRKIQELLAPYTDVAKVILKGGDQADSAMHLLDGRMKTINKMAEIGWVLKDLPELVSMVKDFVKRNYTEVPAASMMAVVSALLYFLNVTDLIPDITFAVGFLDDAAVLTFAMNLVKIDLERYKKWKQERSGGEES
jgi:uncharacterized membrane protein YkvA (DUF1232 family)